MSFDTFVDFETLSLLNVRDVGAWKYAGHPSTLPLMLAYDTPASGRQQWLLDSEDIPLAMGGFFIPHCPGYLEDLAGDPNVLFHAANAGFEIAIWESICVNRWGWPSVPIHRWRCTIAKGCLANQPRALGNLCERLGTSEGKDEAGKNLIGLLSMPQKTVRSKRHTKKKGGGIRTDSVTYLKEHGVETFECADKPGVWYWNHDPKLLADFAAYNLQDIVAEQAADAALPDMSDYEQRVWELDANINARGIPVDRELCQAVMEIYTYEVTRCNARLREIAYDPDVEPKKQVEKVSQRQRIVDWANKRTNFGESLAEENVDAWLKAYAGMKSQDQTMYDGKFVETDIVKEVLELRKLAGGTAVAKFKAALEFIEDDDRCRGQLLYHGASTGRWTGKGIQPHNLFRKAIPDEVYFEAIKRRDYEEVSLLAELSGTTVMDLLKSCVRGLIRAPKGKKLVVSDFAGIEARVLQWVVGANDVLEMFKDPDYDSYVHAAAKVFDIPYEDMMCGPDVRPEYKDKRQVGKICVLALGYQMGAERYTDTCANYGVKIDIDFAADIVTKWREANPLIVQLWYRVERACKHVIKHKRATANIDGYLRMSWDKRGYLCIRLPSGRTLRYFRARIDKETGSIVYYDGSKGLVDTYGGKLVENCLGGNTLVLTEFGWKRIRDITIEEHVFDGIDWVKHGGLVYQGVRPVGEMFGVVLTPDHRVFTLEGWKSASQCEGFTTSPIRVFNSHRIRRFEWAKKSLESALHLWGNCDPPGFRTGSRTWHQNPVLWLQSLGTHVGTASDPPDVETPRLRSLAKHVSEMYERQASCLQKLWWSRDSSIMGFVRAVLGGHEKRVSEWIRHRSDRQQWSLLQEELSMGDETSELRQPPKFHKGWGLFHPRTESTSRNPQEHTVLPPQTRVATYDLMNCGPRRQFVVMGNSGPMIVHNCVQAISRDLLVHSAFLATESGLLLIFHVHDELVAEADEGDTDAMGILDTAMQTIPTWAVGLPLAAESYESKRYTKI